MDQNENKEREQRLHSEYFSQKYHLFFISPIDSLKKWRCSLNTGSSRQFTAYYLVILQKSFH